MKHECKITVLETKCFPELQEKYLADPKSGPCPFFKAGDTFLLKHTPQQDDFYNDYMMVKREKCSAEQLCCLAKQHSCFAIYSFQCASRQ